MAGKNSPWGSGSGGGDNGNENGDSQDGGQDGNDTPPSTPGPRNPWLPGGQSGNGKPRKGANIEDIFRNRGPEGPRRTGGGGPSGPNFRMPSRPGGKSWFPLIIIALVLVWAGATSFHQLNPREQGVITTFGKYTRTIGPGISLTAPWPIQHVDVTDVSSIRRENIPESGNEKLMLTGDQNLVNLSYLIRWNISDLKLYKFQLADPDETVREVGEAAMRASVAEQELDRVLSGAGRAEIEQRVRDRMQAVLNAYKAGITVQGIEIEKTDPPERVIDAFKGVSAAQQEAETEINRARAWAQQLLARAEGDAAAFDKVYAEYRLAPEVTRRRMYYETMERVLSQTDKTIIETDGVVPYLPLPELGRKRSQNQDTASQEQ
ncbi:protease modulator HflK [Altericroceibacterium endophyticum]|uniref:Protease modulator HflK n=1 Tax=Altericroceibacterium endophyticum TaxID=1808508 RepID=A0A6I4T2T0_9SPHN|nr:protease modulator HflK [Altericroceibacterium endophyticum]MXO65166.1 protease modulator HflK [Altericroceibacterium endophyticum]